MRRAEVSSMTEDLPEPSAPTTTSAASNLASGVQEQHEPVQVNHTLEKLTQTIHLSDILPVVRCVEPAEARFVHQHVFFGRVGGYGLAHAGIEVRPGATIVDVGSNIGNFCMWALVALAGNVRLVAMEPVPVLAECLRANVAQYSVAGLTRATVLNVGCTCPAQAGPAAIDFSPGYTLLSTLHRWEAPEVDLMAAGLQRFTGREEASELRRVVESNLLAPSGSVPVILTTLSAALAGEDLRQIDLLKIDAVKSELDILAGLADEDWPKVRQVVVEVHMAGDPTRVERVMQLLRSKGFSNVRSGWPGTPTFLAFKEYGMIRSPAAATDAAAATSVPAPPAPGGSMSVPQAGSGSSLPVGVATAAAAGSQGPSSGEAMGRGSLPELPPPPAPSLGQHLLCAVYAMR